MGIPLLLLLVGLVIFLALPALPPGAAGLAGSYIQVFFAPPALITFFLAGLVAPRAGYLVGFVYGLIAGMIWSLAILTVGVQGDPGTQAIAPIDPLAIALNMLVIGILYGTGIACIGRLVRRVFARILWQPTF